MDTYCDQIFISAPKDIVGYKILAYTNNLDDETRFYTLDICKWLNEHENGKRIWFTYDYTGGASHVVLGVWQDGHMTNVERDEIIQPIL